MIIDWRDSIPPDGIWLVDGMTTDEFEVFRGSKAGLSSAEIMESIRLSGYNVTFVKAKEKPMNLEITNDPTSARTILQEMIDKLRGPDGKPSSREVALAITKLQEARYWLGEAMFGNSY